MKQLQSPTKPSIREDLLYYVWDLKRFILDDLSTTDQLPIEIQNSGYRNHNSGPDFLHARIKIGDQLWIGHVEMHVKASDWLKHGHHLDPAFQNVILHVVYDADCPIKLPNGEPLYCLEMNKRIESEIIARYHELQHSKSWIPCAGHDRQISNMILRSWHERLVVERLQDKTERIDQALMELENDWEEVFYRFLARNFGFKVNAEMFENLAKSLPHKILIRHKDHLQQIEALLFGQAGFLHDDLKDEYGRKLYHEYCFLQKKYGLSALDNHLWKFMRMRPANFPTIRLAQFAILLFKSTHLFSKMLAAKNRKEILHLFASDVSWYWREHYKFDEPSNRRSKKLGRSSIDLIVVNTIVPFLFSYGQKHGDQKLCTRSISLLEEVSAEQNNVIKKFQQLGFVADTALDSQALLQLKHSYCDHKHCLSCAVGNAILRPSLRNDPI